MPHHLFYQILSVMIRTWTGAHSVFAVETFKTGVSVTVTQRAFCVHLMLHQNDAVTD